MATKTKPISLYVSEELKYKITREAVYEGRSVNQQVIKILEEFFSNKL